MLKLRDYQEHSIHIITSVDFSGRQKACTLKILKIMRPSRIDYRKRKRIQNSLWDVSRMSRKAIGKNIIAPLNST